jgi:hypothetical protein
VAPEFGEAVQAARHAGENQDSGEALWSFFREPIFVSGDVLGNGQHRICAMKLARVPRCLIEL